MQRKKQTVRLGLELYKISKRWMSGEAARRMRRCAAVWGNGDYGRLGSGSLDSQWKPKPLLSSAFHHQSLVSIACGGAHTLFLTDTGRVYATGLNDFGQLGASDNIAYSMEPLEVSGLQKEIAQISAGYHHSCAITVDGELYMWGKNSNGQLGLGKKSEKAVPAPTKVECLNGIAIKRIALSSEHSVAVTGGGEALSWGEGSSQLGHGHELSFWGFSRSTSEYTPRLIKQLEGIKVINVAAGLLHSACIDENGSVFVFGEGIVDKLGSGEAKDARTPSMMSRLPFSREVACGGYHICVVTSGGELYAWGSNDNGCLGIGSITSLYSPERVEGPFSKSTVDKISCGWKHTAAISEGKIFTWGWGGSHGTFSENELSSGGQLGHGSDVDHMMPTLVEFGNNVKALEVSCGFNHTGAILEYIEA